jgi:DNA replication and repair protein RecF
LKIKALSLENFRNYQSEKIIWHDKINVICGMNAQGKSNLLEAICYLSLSSSFRGATDSELLSYEKDFFRLCGDVENKEINSQIVVAYNKNKRKFWQIDGQSKTKISQIIGRFHTIIFSPEDLYLVKSGPETRRKFFDRLMAQLYPDFYALLLRYHQTLRQRNRLLKTDTISDEQLAPWNQQFAFLAAQIVKRRLEALKSLMPFAAKIHKNISQKEQLSVAYQGLLSENILYDLSIEQLTESYLSAMARLAQAEKIRMITLLGPHRDDFQLLIDNLPARRFASQGQQRSAALSLKLAEMELAKAKRDYYPVLLLDDVMSELDIYRRQQLLSLMTGKAQTFITATDLNFRLLDGEKFIVENGKIKP